MKQKQSKRQRWEYQKSWRSKNPDRVRAIARRWYRKNRELNRDSVRRSQLKTKYGFAQELYEVFFFMQCGECAVCGAQPQPKKHLCVDHDHKTGRVRGLLCNRCNISIGAFDDDPALMNKAVTYLRKHA